MTEPVAVSVVIPVYNGSGTLATAVASALCQEGVPLEVIVVDDGSTDAPASMLSDNPRVRLLTVAHGGVSTARNRGWMAARGRMLIFLDADDALTDPTAARDHLALLDESPTAAFSASGWEIVDADGTTLTTRTPWTRVPKLDLEHWIAYPVLHIGAAAFRRDRVQAVGGFDESLQQVEDVDFVSRLLMNGTDARWLPRVTHSYRRHDGNASRNLDAQADAMTIVLDRVFRSPGLAPEVAAQECLVRYHVHVWLASRYHVAGRSKEMATQLAASTLWTDLPRERLPIDWMDAFVEAYADAGDPPLDVVGLGLDPAWQDLMRSPLPRMRELGAARGGAALTAPVLVRPRPVDAIDAPEPSNTRVDQLPAPAIDLTSARSRDYGRHRSGWAYALDALAPLHVDGGVFVDAFVEHTFDDPTRGPHTAPWIGFLHNPPELPAWYPIDQSARRLLGDERFRRSLPMCRGLFTLSASLRDWWTAHVDVAVESIWFPTGSPMRWFSTDAFTENPFASVVQVGTWLRKLHAIDDLPVQRLRRLIVHQHAQYIDELFAVERAALHLRPRPHQVDTLPFVDDAGYDELLSCNLVFIELYAASANNTVVECMVRGTPILVNPLPAVREYLGDDYPLYFSSRTEAARKAENPSLVADAHAYLARRPLTSELTFEHFLDAIASSAIYRGLTTLST
jgi:GT2 family glycosyltransferase